MGEQLAGTYHMGEQLAGTYHMGEQPAGTYHMGEQLAGTYHMGECSCVNATASQASDVHSNESDGPMDDVAPAFSAKRWVAVKGWLHTTSTTAGKM
jgi:hypothetical protein